MKPSATKEQVDTLVARLGEFGVTAHLSEGAERTIVGAVGDLRGIETGDLQALAGVERVIRVVHPFKLASLDFHPQPTVVRAGRAAFGDGGVTVIAGPCAVEDPDGYLAVARAVKAAGARMLRGGAFKPRTSPYAFQGLGRSGLRILEEARRETGLPFVTEVLAAEDLDDVAGSADMLQVGARNAQNFPLLRLLGRAGRPVLLKRGMSQTIEEWLMAADYILSEGNPDVVLCERGIRTFETMTRNTLDLSAVALVRELSHLPVIVDPSHSSGRASLVPALAAAAVAAGADGLIIEVHACPDRALCDGAQSLTPEAFAEAMNRLGAVARSRVYGRSPARGKAGLQPVVAGPAAARGATAGAGN